MKVDIKESIKNLAPAVLEAIIALFIVVLLLYIAGNTHYQIVGLLAFFGVIFVILKFISRH